ncbi:DUF397 domain-containing protein [Streptomyces uncialis]|uniref:DUF397 domain-containing protein n=1 Tax=Streptomyces uncialis TaxID=1048205 RepID=UPI00225584D5|nr:DUF397 domain-containing protein [Streptomyces uncialis]MCX4663750.1 DUF397 domain-containing protein [Streptomyces uncialis]
MTVESPQRFTSSYSSNGGACIKVATNLVASHGVVPVRDSKQTDSRVLALSLSAFTGLVAFARTTDVS